MNNVNNNKAINFVLCKYFIVFNLLFILFPIESLCQNVTGKIVDDQGNPIAYASIVLKSIHDSIVDGTISNDNGEFIFNRQIDLPFILQVSFVGYKTWSKKIFELPIPNIVLIFDEKTLDEIVIVGEKQKIIENNNGTLSVNVAKSFLKNETDIFHLLSKVPGIKVANQGITLFGKNSLAIYIDDRKIMSNEEYTSLQPSDIVRIELIRNPGAEYDANTDAVLKIYTNRISFIPHTKFSINNRTAINHGIENSTSLVINHSRKSITQTFNYNINGSLNSIRHDISHTYNFLPTYTSLSINNTDIDNNRFRQSIFYGLSYKLSNKLMLGVQYMGYLYNKKGRTDGSIEIFNNDDRAFYGDIYGENSYSNPLHNFSLNFTLNMTAKLKFSLVGDYVYTYNKTFNHIEEELKNGGIRVNENNSDNRYHIYSANSKLIYSREHLIFTLGLKVSYLKNKSYIWSSAFQNNDIIQLNDFTGAAYSQITIRTKPLDFKLGLRGEITKSKQHSNTHNEVNLFYKNLFPYISLEKNIGKSLDLTLSYRKSIKRPSIEQLDPAYIYTDTLSYMSGNPYLKPVIIDYTDLLISFKSFSIDLGYSRYMNSICFMFTQDNDNPNIINTTYGNLDKINKVYHAGLTYNFNYKILSTLVSLMVDKPYYQVPFQGTYILKNKALWYFQTQVNARLTQWLALSGSYFYNSNGDFQELTYQAYSSFDLGLKSFLLKKQLQISISYDDIFHTNYYNSWETEYSNVRFVMHTIPDSRVFSFSIKYTFGADVKAIQKKSSSKEIRDRIN